MRYLDFVVNKQLLTKSENCDFSNIVKDSKRYLYARFSFSGDWYDSTKYAVFTCTTGTYTVRLVNDECEIPTEACACDTFMVSAIGVKDDTRITSGSTSIIQRRCI